MNDSAYSQDQKSLKQKAEISIKKAKELILETIPHDEIISIYVKGSFVQDEMVDGSDVDVVVILKDEKYLPAVYQITEEYGHSVNPPFQIVAYTLKELQTGEKASNRIRNTTAVSRFVKHLDSLPLIFGARPEGPLFTRTHEKDLVINIKNFRNMYLPEYKEGKFGFKQIVKQVFWLVEAEQRYKGLEPGYSWQKLADLADDNSDSLMHLALRYRREDKVSEKEQVNFIENLERYLSALETSLSL